MLQFPFSEQIEFPYVLGNLWCWRSQIRCWRHKKMWMCVLCCCWETMCGDVKTIPWKVLCSFQIVHFWSWTESLSWGGPGQEPTLPHHHLSVPSLQVPAYPGQDGAQPRPQILWICLNSATTQLWGHSPAKKNWTLLILQIPGASQWSEASFVQRHSVCVCVLVVVFIVVVVVVVSSKLVPQCHAMYGPTLLAFLSLYWSCVDANFFFQHSWFACLIGKMLMILIEVQRKLRTGEDCSTVWTVTAVDKHSIAIASFICIFLEKENRQTLFSSHCAVGNHSLPLTTTSTNLSLFFTQILHWKCDMSCEILTLVSRDSNAGLDLRWIAEVSGQLLCV